MPEGGLQQDSLGENSKLISTEYVFIYFYIVSVILVKNW